MNPIDIIANAIRAASSAYDRDAGGLASVAANALTNDEIVGNAVAALRAAGWDDIDGEANLEPIARVVLGSVAGGA